MRAFILIVFFCLFQLNTAYASCPIFHPLRSNFETIDAAQVIAIGTARDSHQNKFIEFHIDEIIKGDAVKSAFSYGHFTDENNTIAADDIFGYTLGGWGPCQRVTFQQDKQYVLFLEKNTDGKFYVNGDIHSRLAEDYHGPDSHWIKLIKAYLNIQKNPDRLAQMQVMQELADAYSGNEKDMSFAQQMRKDALLHVTSIHSDKPSEWLIQKYETPHFFRDYVQKQPVLHKEMPRNLSEENVKFMALAALSEGEHLKALPFIDALAEKNIRPDEVEIILAYYLNVKKIQKAKLFYAENATTLFLTETERFLSTYDLLLREFDLSPKDQAWWQEQKFGLCVIRDGRCGKLEDFSFFTTDANFHRKLFAHLGLREHPEAIKWAEETVEEAIEKNAFDRTADAALTVLINAGDGWQKLSPLIDQLRWNSIHPLLDQLSCGTKKQRHAIAQNLGETLGNSNRDHIMTMMTMPQSDDVKRELIDSAIRLESGSNKYSKTNEYLLDYIKADEPLPREMQRISLSCWPKIY